jgi:hypothetical protein
MGGLNALTRSAPQARPRPRRHITRVAEILSTLGSRLRNYVWPNRTDSHCISIRLEYTFVHNVCDLSVEGLGFPFS